MFRIRHSSFRTLAACVLLLATQVGCSDDAPTAPVADEPPVLPDPARLRFDFGFFQEPSALERASKANFFNAYIRATVASAVTHFLLVPPVTAFSLALHTVPSPQPDGSYLWIYTWVSGTEEAQIRLRGKREGAGRVTWELRVSSSVEGWVNELWFEGETWSGGDEGLWRFHGFEREGKPVVASLAWGHDDAGDFLRLADELDNVGDSLEYRADGPRKSFTWTDADLPSQSWYVRWDVSNGTGSLRAPDYNGGQPACWDERQNDVECPPPAA